MNFSKIEDENFSTILKWKFNAVLLNSKTPQKDFIQEEFSLRKNNRTLFLGKCCWRLLTFCQKMTKNVGLNQDSNQGPSRKQKKWDFFCLKLYHWAKEALHITQPKYCFKICEQQTLYNEYGTLPILHLKYIKDAFFNKQIIEIRKKMHIDSFFTYSHSEIALKACRNIQRFKFDCRPLHHVVKTFIK